MSSTNQVSGLSSGFDWRSMVDQLIAIEHKPADSIEKQKTQYETQLSEWRSFNSDLLSLKTAAAALSKPDNFNVFSSSMTSDNANIDAEDLLSVSTNSYAAKGTYNITINNIATAQKIGSASFASGTNDLGAGYDGDIIINDKTITISETDGLDDIRNKINGADAGVTASLIRYSDTDYRLNLTSDDTGAEGINLANGGAADILELMGWTNSGVLNELVVGQDASFLLDGIEVTSEDNVIDDVLTGVTFKFTGEDAATTITLNIERDTSAIEEKIKTFVDAYNEVSSYIKEQQTYNEVEKSGGVLFGDGTLSSIKSDLTSLLVDPVWGVSSKFSIMGLAGISVDIEGQLSIDSVKLGEYLETNFSDIQKLFSVNGSSTSGSIEYLYSTNDTKAGNYAVNITQVGTKSSSSSTTAVSGTLGSDQTLTITSGDNTANISLTSDMTISDIVTAVNSELDTVYTEKMIGDTNVTSGATAVTSSTTWGTIDGSSLVDGNSISFSGTARDGSSVSGSYAITSTATETIQGLLTEIESAFNNDVTASIDVNGRLVLTDNDEGSSDLSFSLDAAGAAIFGTVLTTNTDGQEGRYAMTIGASNDGSDHLTLSSDSYGSGHSFTIDSTLWSGSPVTTTDGQDIAGTINGEAATGKGQTLTGDEDAANIAGLSINYTGSSTGNVGNIKFTTGVAERFDRALYNITDSIDGYVANKIDSLSDQIENKDELIDNIEARLDRKMEAMINRFVSMELALSRMQNQAQWLSGQIASLYG
jgi:flagellar hook-associated protein 2